MGYNGGYGGGYGGYGGFGGCGGYQPCCGYEEPKRGNSFALLVVLFILLIIIGSHFHKKC